MLVYLLDCKSDILGVGLGASLSLVVSEEVEPAFCVCVCVCGVFAKERRYVLVWVRGLSFLKVSSDVRELLLLLLLCVPLTHVSTVSLIFIRNG